MHAARTDICMWLGSLFLLIVGAGLMVGGRGCCAVRNQVGYESRKSALEQSRCFVAISEDYEAETTSK
jgi:hypothetical protein